MLNPFFKNNGPFNLKDILNELSLNIDQNNENINIIDIKDLQNSRINEIQCGILNLKIPKVNFWIKQRRKLAKIYTTKLRNSSLKLPFENKNNNHVFHLYVVYHPKRDEIIKQLKRHNIQVNINYPYPIHQMKGYINKVKLPVTEKMSKGIFSLPLYPNIKINKLIRVTKVLKKILSKI